MRIEYVLAQAAHEALDDDDRKGVAYQHDPVGAAGGQREGQQHAGDDGRKGRPRRAFPHDEVHDQLRHDAASRRDDGQHERAQAEEHDPRR